MRILATLFVTAMSLGVTWAQSQAFSQIQGTIQDASGSPVPVLFTHTTFQTDL